MPDDITQPLAPESPVGENAGGLKGFLGSKAGKIVAVGAVVGLLVLVGIVVAVVMLFSSKPEVQVITPVSNGASAAASSTATGGSEDATSVPPAVPDSEIFTFRDVFKPLIVKPLEDENPLLPGGSTGATSTAGDSDTLYLQDVIVEGGQDKAVLTFNGSQHTLGEGEVVTGTPWKVLTIDASSDSVVMLYGDSQVTLTVGQGTSSGK